MNKPQSPSLRSTAFLACAVFILDAFFLGQGFIGGLAGVIGFIWGTLGYFFFKDPAQRQRKLKIGLIWLTTAIATICCIIINNKIARARAEKLIIAVQSYKSKTGHFPKNLTDLVPAYIANVPNAKYALSLNTFVYYNSDEKPFLLYTSIAPFGRPTYVFDRGEWVYLD